MKIYKDLEKLLEREIREVVQSDELTATSLDLMDKVLDEIKDIETICAMKHEEEEYSERMMYDSYGRDARRYASGEGRYRRNQYGNSYGQYDDAYGYGYHEDLDRMMNEAKTEKERELIRQLKEAKRA